MPTFTPGTKSDVVVFQENVYSGIIEILEQNSDFVTENTNGAIVYLTQSLKGDFEEASFWDASDDGDLVSDRDPTATGDADITGFSQESLISPKCNLSIGPKQQSADSFRKIQEDPQTMGFLFGTKAGKALSVDWLNRSLTAGVACLTKSADTHFDVSGAPLAADQVISSKVLNRALGSKMGDARERIVAWVMHSAAFTELTEGSIVDKLTGITDRIVYGGSTPSLGLPVLVSDSPALIDEANGTYTVLALTRNALIMRESEGGVDIRMMDVLGKKNIMSIIQGETAVNVSVKGWSYTGAASPDMAALGNAANWAYKFADVKSGAGLAITVKAIDEAADAS
jgi:hypothetical protein